MFGGIPHASGDEPWGKRGLRQNRQSIPHASGDHDKHMNE